MISAKIVADSKNEFGQRITTMVVTMPRIILAEFNTHRMFSRNSASSRAIPFEKMVKSVEENPFIPIAWQRDHKGMQGNEYFENQEEIKDLIGAWLQARNNAINSARELHFEGTQGSLTKQLCNRLLEPFMYHTVIVTSTEFENFFALRSPQYVYEDTDDTGNSKGKEIHRSKKDYQKAYGKKGYDELGWLKKNKGQAEIHMMDLAEKMWDCMNDSTPKQLKAGEWHIPFEDNIINLDVSPAEQGFWTELDGKEKYSKALQEAKIKIATAMCARVSYTVVGDEKEISYESLIGIHDRMSKQNPLHASPFEHCARAMTEREWINHVHGIQDYESTEITDDIMGWSRNFRGFVQYREILEEQF